MSPVPAPDFSLRRHRSLLRALLDHPLNHFSSRLEVVGCKGHYVEHYSTVFFHFFCAVQQILLFATLLSLVLPRAILDTIDTIDNATTH
jgi:hypothetical protein